MILYDGLLISLVILALAVIMIRKLRIVAIVFGVFSIAASLCYLMLAAPDVALAEAIIGCSISTVIFLVGIRKYRVCTICALPSNPQMDDTMRQIIDRCAAKKELEPHLIPKSTQAEMEHIFYDVGYQITENQIHLFGEPENFILEDIRRELAQSFPDIPLLITRPEIEQTD